MDDLTRAQLEALASEPRFIPSGLCGVAVDSLARQLLATMDRAERMGAALADIVQLATDPVPPFETNAMTFRRECISATARAALEEKP